MTPEQDAPRLMVSPREAGTMLGVPEETIRVWIRQGRLSASKLAPRTIRIRVADIERLVEERKL